MAYSTQERVELMFGNTNVKKWADLDNTNDAAVVATRIAQTLADSEDYVNGRLILGRYDAPFATAPKIVVFIVTLYTGILLYDGRLISGTENQRDQLSRHRKTFNKYIREILNGQLKLTDILSGEAIETTAYPAPFVSQDTEVTTTVSDDP